MLTITSAAPLCTSFLRISSSLPRASPAEFPITKPARPCSFSAA
jgi:hypothetical protein